MRLSSAHEDKKRADAFNDERLTLADSKLDHFKDKIALLEEKLQVAKGSRQCCRCSRIEGSNDRLILHVRWTREDLGPSSS